MQLTKEQEIFIIGTFCGVDVSAVDVRRKFLLKNEMSGRPKYQYLARDIAHVFERFNKNGIGISPRLIPSASEAYTTNISWGYCVSLVRKQNSPYGCAHGPVSK